MSDICPWCDGDGCDECGNIPAVVAAVVSPTAPVTMCDWCDGAGCEECGGMEMASNPSVMCDNVVETDTHVSVEEKILQLYYSHEYETNLDKKVVAFRQIIELYPGVEILSRDLVDIKKKCMNILCLVLLREGVMDEGLSMLPELLQTLSPTSPEFTEILDQCYKTGNWLRLLDILKNTRSLYHMCEPVVIEYSIGVQDTVDIQETDKQVFIKQLETFFNLSETSSHTVSFQRPSFTTALRNAKDPYLSNTRNSVLSTQETITNTQEVQANTKYLLQLYKCKYEQLDQTQVLEQLLGQTLTETSGSPRACVVLLYSMGQYYVSQNMMSLAYLTLYQAFQISTRSAHSYTQKCLSLAILCKWVADNIDITTSADIASIQQVSSASSLSALARGVLQSIQNIKRIRSTQDPSFLDQQISIKQFDQALVAHDEKYARSISKGLWQSALTKAQDVHLEGKTVAKLSILKQVFGTVVDFEKTVTTFISQRQGRLDWSKELVYTSPFVEKVIEKNYAVKNAPEFSNKTRANTHQVGIVAEGETPTHVQVQSHMKVKAADQNAAVTCEALFEQVVGSAWKYNLANGRIPLQDPFLTDDQEK